MAYVSLNVEKIMNELSQPASTDDKESLLDSFRKTSNIIKLKNPDEFSNGTAFDIRYVHADRNYRYYAYSVQVKKLISMDFARHLYSNTLRNRKSTKTNPMTYLKETYDEMTGTFIRYLIAVPNNWVNFCVTHKVKNEHESVRRDALLENNLDAMHSFNNDEKEVLLYKLLQSKEEYGTCYAYCIESDWVMDIISVQEDSIHGLYRDKLSNLSYDDVTGIDKNDINSIRTYAQNNMYKRHNNGDEKKTLVEFREMHNFFPTRVLSELSNRSQFSIKKKQGDKSVELIKNTILRCVDD